MSNSDIEYILEFDDQTILESKDGRFENVNKIMLNESLGYPKWMIESGLQMRAVLGGRIYESSFLLHFYENGDIYIMEYAPSSEEIFTNPDIRGLHIWAGENGWKRIIPANDLVRTNIDFWKYYWETNLIDSDFLDKNYGYRSVGDKENND